MYGTRRPILKQKSNKRKLESSVTKIDFKKEYNLNPYSIKMQKRIPEMYVYAILNFMEILSWCI